MKQKYETLRSIRPSVILHNFANKNRILEYYGNISPLEKGEKGVVEFNSNNNKPLAPFVKGELNHFLFKFIVRIFRLSFIKIVTFIVKEYTKADPPEWQMDSLRDKEELYIFFYFQTLSILLYSANKIDKHLLI